MEIYPETDPLPERVKTTSLKVVTPTFTSCKSLPKIRETWAAAPPPSVPLLSKFKLSPTLKLSPAETIWKSLRFPEVTDSIIEVSGFISYDSITKL